MDAVLSAARQYGLFIGLCVFLEIARVRGWIVSRAEHRRALTDSDKAAQHAVDVEKRIGDLHEQRADREAARADRADAALAKMNAELPAALNALAASKAGAS